MTTIATFVVIVGAALAGGVVAFWIGRSVLGMLREAWRARAFGWFLASLGLVLVVLGYIALLIAEVPA